MGGIVNQEMEARTGRRRHARTESADLYDFTRPDRIPQSQIRAIQLVYENAARSLSASLSAQLAAYVSVNAVAFSQISYREFIQGMPSPSVIATMSLEPFDGFGVLDLTPALVFPILEMLMGRRARFGPPAEREITDIEARLLEGVVRLILQDLREAWKAIGAMEFKLQSISKEPQFVQALAPSEAVLSVTIPVQVGETEAPMYVALPALAIGRMRQNTGPQWQSAAVASPVEQEEMLTLLEAAATRIRVQIPPTNIRVADLLALKVDDLLITDHSIHRAFTVTVNGRPTMTGDVVRAGRKLAVELGGFFEAGADAHAPEAAGTNGDGGAA